MADKARLTDKRQQPTAEAVQLFLGEAAWQRLLRFEQLLRERYALSRELKFPFGSAYGWGFRYAHKNALLLYVFFEEGGFCATISINDKGAPLVEAMLESLLPETQALWRNRYPCGADGGWIHCSVAGDEVLPDLIRLLGAKIKPQTAALRGAQ